MIGLKRITRDKITWIKKKKADCISRWFDQPERSPLWNWQSNKTTLDTCIWVIVLRKNESIRKRNAPFRNKVYNEESFNAWMKVGPHNQAPDNHHKIETTIIFNHNLNSLNFLKHESHTPVKLNRMRQDRIRKILLMLLEEHVFN